MKLLRFSSLLFCIIIAPFLVRGGELKVFPLFTHHGILQQDTDVPIWGTAGSGEVITLTYREAKVTTTSDHAGKWLAHLKTPKAEPGKTDGYDLTISSLNGQVILNDVVVGEVWIGSGQSNMETSMSLYLVGRNETPKADYPGIRLYSAAYDGGRSVTGDFSKYQWNRCTPETVSKASAAGYFFSRDLHKALNVPVGFINMAVGGSPLASWVLPAWMEADPRMASNFETFKTATFPDFIENRKSRLESWQALVAEAKAKGQPPTPSWPPFPGAADQPLENFIGSNHSTHTAVTMPFVFKGMLWDQGESTVGFALKGAYDVIFDIMVQNLRRDFGYNLPVIYCQMPKGGGWGPTIFTIDKSGFPQPLEAIPLADLPAEAPKAGPIFESFAKEADPFIRMNALPGCFMATTRDLQAALHPHNKDEYGARFCVVALKRIYGKNREDFGPMITSAKRVGREIQLGFDHVGGGLVALGGKPLQGFYGTAASGKSAWAHCRIEGDHVVLSGPGIEDADTVSYANTNGGRVLWANLFNNEGLPAFPMTVKVQ